jgi:hypothetical protein
MTKSEGANESVIEIRGTREEGKKRREEREGEGEE